MVPTAVLNDLLNSVQLHCGKMQQIGVHVKDHVFIALKTRCLCKGLFKAVVR
jgi:hypothetical protein